MQNELTFLACLSSNFLSLDIKCLIAWRPFLSLSQISWPCTVYIFYFWINFSFYFANSIRLSYNCDFNLYSQFYFIWRYICHTSVKCENIFLCKKLGDMSQNSAEVSGSGLNKINSLAWWPDQMHSALLKILAFYCREINACVHCLSNIDFGAQSL